MVISWSSYVLQVFLQLRGSGCPASLGCATLPSLRGDFSKCCYHPDLFSYSFSPKFGSEAPAWYGAANDIRGFLERLIRHCSSRCAYHGSPGTSLASRYLDDKLDRVSTELLVRKRFHFTRLATQSLGDFLSSQLVCSLLSHANTNPVHRFYTSRTTWPMHSAS